MDMRDMRGGMGDGRNPYGSRGGYVVSSRGGRGRGRGRRGDRGMDYAEDMARGGRGGRGGDRGMEDGRVIRSYPTMHPQGDYGDYARGGRGRGDDRAGGDYGDYDMARNRDYGDMRGDRGYGDMRGGEDYGDMGRGRGDGHYMHGGRQGGYEPVEFMGYCSGYYGSPDQDYARGRDYGYDMRGDYARGGRRDYGYDYGDYGDYGETLSEKELEHWGKKLKGKLDEREKQMFSKETIAQKAKQMGREMKGFGIEELEIVTLLLYDDYKKSIGQNPDLAIKLAFDWLDDKDASVKGAEKLAVYYDCIVEGEE